MVKCSEIGINLIHLNTLHDRSQNIAINLYKSYSAIVAFIHLC